MASSSYSNKAGKVTTGLTVSVDLLLAGLMGTQPGISCEVQRVDILPLMISPPVLSQRAVFKVSLTHDSNALLPIKLE